MTTEKRVQLKWEVIPDGQAHNQKSTALHCGHLSPWNQELTPCSRAKHSDALRSDIDSLTTLTSW